VQIEVLIPLAHVKPPRGFVAQAGIHPPPSPIIGNHSHYVFSRNALRSVDLAQKTTHWLATALRRGRSCIYAIAAKRPNAIIRRNKHRLHRIALASSPLSS
jgi:predicted nucleic acid-binding Zn ribbon protein